MSMCNSDVNILQVCFTWILKIQNVSGLLAAAEMLAATYAPNEVALSESLVELMRVADNLRTSNVSLNLFR
jgi:hypothetical protein